MDTRNARSRGERGASSVEYGLLAVAIAAVIVFAVIAFGGQVRGLFETTCTSVHADVASNSSCT